MSIRYPTFEEVRQLHDEIMIRLDAEPQPLIKPNALDSALHRVQNLTYYEPDISIHDQAAMLAISIAQAQAFLDGNKRTAYITTSTFFRYNHYKFTGSTLQLAKFIELQAFLSMIEGKGDEPAKIGRETLAIWLQTTTHPTR